MAQYLPGAEPENIKCNLQKLFSKLDSAYPDKRIIGLTAEHKKWAEAATALYRTLGYPDKKSFLEAYGYTYLQKAGGRPATVDPKAVIRALQEKYPDGSPYTKVEELFSENPEYQPNLKTLKNVSTEVFGMPLGQYLKTIGLLQGKPPAGKPDKKEKCLVCKVSLAGLSQSRYCTSDTRSIHVGDHVEILLGAWSIPVFGDVEEVLECDEGNMPCDLSNIQKIARKISKTEYEKNFTHSLIYAIAAVDTNNLISETPAIPFCAAQTAETFAIGTALWACVRGLSAEVLEVLTYLIQKDKQVYTDNDLILMETGISELYIYTEDVMDVMQMFPDVKIAAFAETGDGDSVELWYSRSGYRGITNTCEIGTYNLTSKIKWTLKHSPTDDFTANKRKYRFPFREDWDAINYVFTDQTNSRKQLGK